jgi:DNA primase
MSERSGPDEGEQHRLLGVLTALAEQETARLHTGTVPWTWWLERAARYGRYGFCNTLLIAAQYRFASDVRSYDQWRAQGRQVRGGERAIRVTSRTGRSRPVFDLAQTDGPPLPARRAATPAEAWSALHRVAVARTFAVERTGNRPAAVTPPGRIPVDAALTDDGAARVLAHQLAHVLLHAARIDRPDGPGCRGVERVEADSVAYLVLAHLGLDRSGLTFPPTTGWAGDDPYDLAAVGGRVLTAAARIRAQLDSAGPRTRPVPAPEPHAGRPAEPEGPSRGELVAMHVAAHRFFLSRLAGGWAPAYLTGRGLDPAVQHDWEVGYAPRGWRMLTDHLRALGHTGDAIVASGLGRRGRGGWLFDTFHDRVVLPLRDRDGAIVGFVGRRPDGASGPVYLNSPQSPIFRKRELLFGLYETGDRLARGARPVITEGPFDAIAVNTADPDHAAVASCGTTITAEQVRALGRAADLATTGLLLALDGDRAGRDAAVRAWDLLARVPGRVGVVLLGEGRDPAGVLSERGPEGVREVLGAEIPLADVVVDAAVERHAGSLQFAEGRLAAARAAAAVIADVPTGQVARHVARVAVRLGMDPAIVTDALVSVVSPGP